jgi:hypothetical protein
VHPMTAARIENATGPHPDEQDYPDKIDAARRECEKVRRETDTER